MMDLNVILLLPENTTFATLPPEIQSDALAWGAEWPQGGMPGTVPYLGDRVYHILFTKFPDADPMPVLHQSLGLTGFEVLGCQSPGGEAYTPLLFSKIETFLPDTDDDGGRPTNLSGLHHYAGHQPWVET